MKNASTSGAASRGLKTREPNVLDGGFYGPGGHLVAIGALFQTLVDRSGPQLTRRARGLRWQVLATGRPVLGKFTGAEFEFDGGTPRAARTQVCVEGDALGSRCNCTTHRVSGFCEHVAAVAAVGAEEFKGGRVPPAFAEVVRAFEAPRAQTGPSRVAEPGIAWPATQAAPPPGRPDFITDPISALRALDHVLAQRSSVSGEGQASATRAPAGAPARWRITIPERSEEHLAVDLTLDGAPIDMLALLDDAGLRATPQDARVASLVATSAGSIGSIRDQLFGGRDASRKRRRGMPDLGELLDNMGFFDQLEDVPQVDPWRLVELLVGHPRVDMLFPGRRKVRPARIESGEIRIRLSRIEPEPVVEVPLAALGTTAKRSAAKGYALEATFNGRTLGGPDTGTIATQERFLTAFASDGFIGISSLGLGDADLVMAIVQASGRFSPEAACLLVDRFDRLGGGIPIEIPDELKGREVAPESRLLLRFTPVVTGGIVAELRARPIPGGPAFAPGEGAPSLAALSGGERLRTTRDLALERALAVARGALLDPRMAAPLWGITLDGDDLMAFIERLEGEAGKDLPVEWPEGIARRRVVKPEAGALTISVRDAQDWFGLDGALEVDGERVEVAALLAAARQGRRYVEVGKGSGRHVALKDLLGGRLEELALLSKERKEGALLPKVAASLAADILPAESTGSDPAWARCLERMKDARALDVGSPDGLVAALREYQLEGYRWLRRMALLGGGCCLADEMGLGKTVQAIALLLARRADGPALVVAPTSVGFNWEREIARFAPTLTARPFREGDREATLRAAGPGDVVIATYGLARLEVEPLAKVAWGTLILDEAQFVKNGGTDTAKAVRAIPAAFVLALTGTPLENRLGELHSLFDRIAPGLLGGRDEFTERFARPIEGAKDADRRKALARIVRPFILRRRKSEVLQELPSRTEMRIDVDLSPRERTIYERERLDILAKLAGVAEAEGEDARFIVLAGLTRLRQVACHARLVDGAAPKVSAKLAALGERLQDLAEEGRKALVVSQFTRHLDLAREAIEKAGLATLTIEGKTPPRERERVVDAFQKGPTPVLLVSLKAGGTGLNLTAADTVFLMDPWWNPAVEDQAGDRAHRYGQTRAVTIVRLVARKTVEEKVLALHAEKRDLVEGVLEGTERAGKLSVTELVSLIRDGVFEGGETAVPDEAPLREAQRPAATSKAPKPDVTPKALPAPKAAAPAAPPDAATDGAATWAEILEAYRNALAVTCTPNTLAAYVDAVQRIAARTDGARAPLDGLAAHLRRLCEQGGDCSPSTAKLRASALSKLLDVVTREPRVSADAIGDARQALAAYRIASKDW